MPMERVRNSEEFISETIARHNLYKMRLVCKTTTILLVAIMIVKIITLRVSSEIVIVEHLSFTPYILIILFNVSCLIYDEL